MLLMRCATLAVLVGGLALTSPAIARGADRTDAGDWSISFGGIMSHQPGGTRDCSRCDPTRDVVAGDPVGASLAIERRTPSAVLLAFEASSTAPVSGISEGSGCDFITQVC